MKSSKIAMFLFAVMLFLTACGAKPRELPVVPAGVSVNGVKDVMSKASAFHSGGVAQEANLTRLWNKQLTSRSKYRTSVEDLIGNNTICFKNAQETQVAVAKAVFDRNYTTQQAGAIVANVLSTGGASVTGDKAITACTELNKQIADFMIANRAEVADNYNLMFDAASEYMRYTSSSPEIDIMNDLMRTYLDVNKVYDALHEAGIPGVSDWTWLPTVNLWVSHSDKALCIYYISGDFKNSLLPEVKRKFERHAASLENLYAATWNPVANGGKGECRMYRMAALEYMTRPIINESVRQDVQNGDDSSVFAKPTPR